LSTDEQREHGAEWTTADTVAGFLAAAALAAGALALVWYPGRVGPAAMLIALVAAAMGRGQSRLAGGALAAVTVCWLAGMIIAVLTNRAIF
jgi:hypothetical protein